MLNSYDSIVFNRTILEASAMKADLRAVHRDVYAKIKHLQMLTQHRNVLYQSVWTDSHETSARPVTSTRADGRRQHGRSSEDSLPPGSIKDVSLHSTLTDPLVRDCDVSQ